MIIHSIKSSVIANHVSLRRKLFLKAFSFQLVLLVVQVHPKFPNLTFPAISKEYDSGTQIMKPTCKSDGLSPKLIVSNQTKWPSFPATFDVVGRALRAGGVPFLFN